MPNALTRHVGLNAGTWVVETLVKHYFDHLFKEKSPEALQSVSGNLRQDELLYDEVFHIVKSFLDASTHHTVEDLQRFSNARTPSSPWMHVVRVLVPMSSCDAAAAKLIEALGGEEKIKQVVGGTKWWQVRGLKGVDAQWIVARKDYHQAKKRWKQFEQAEKERKQSLAESEEAELVYRPEMDEMRCILYFHGGGYYFGSIDQERYFIQRYARKSGCRLLALNYRLAPQYPFPCAIQDALAAYLYLINPPEGALHRPVNPAHIVISGDSAGGGLSFALLQVIRDTGLPQPAGGVLISPWCDMTHSFPSIHLNTETDVIPKYGLSLHKPSALWPPPPDDLTAEVHESLRKRIKRMAWQYSEKGHVRADAYGSDGEERQHRSFWRRKLSLGNRSKSRSTSRARVKCTADQAETRSLAEDALTGDVRSSAVSRVQSTNPDRSQGQTEEEGKRLEVGSTASLPLPGSLTGQTISLTTDAGEKLLVHDQVQLYAPNSLLAHPLVSPALSYLGGLPPLHIIASDAEVLRDEILYAAHKAAHPEKYPVKAEARQLYPNLEGIESRYGPTKVHLQVYDQTAHVLPVLFSFCTPAKFCFRAMAAFTKYVTKTLENPTANEVAVAASPPSSPTVPAFRRALSLSLPRRSSLMGKRRSTALPPQTVPESSSHVNGVESPSRQSSEGSSRSASISQAEGVRYAGNTDIYFGSSSDQPFSPFTDNMIRERVSTRGVIRPLEPERDLAACTLPPDRVGVVAELAVRRYIEGRTKWDERYARTIKAIRKLRARSLNIAKSETVRNVTQLQMHFFQNVDDQALEQQRKVGRPRGVPSTDLTEGLRKSAASWTWAWAIDGDEHPPPSSIVARRDTDEARRLSKIADQPTTEDEQRISGNNLWSFLVNLLSLEKAPHNHKHESGSSKEQNGHTSYNSTNMSSRKSSGTLRRLLAVAGSDSKRPHRAPIFTESSPNPNESTIIVHHA